MSSGGKIYGIAPVFELLRAGKRLAERLVYAEGLSNARLPEILRMAREQRVPVEKATRPTLARLVEKDANHQGIVAFVAAREYASADDLVEKLAAKVGRDTPPLAVILDGVEDPHNLGAIARTVDQAGADGIFIPERRAVGLTETVAKAAAGALEYVPVARVVNISRLIEELKSRNIWVVGAAGEAKMDYTEWDWRQPTVLVLGGEGKGLHRLVAENCDALVSIPSSSKSEGRIDSLNVSVAAGVILFEAVRQRGLEK
jgi:23S rRNA (guanosine2251-2'-O)-methyltransferase